MADRRDRMKRTIDAKTDPHVLTLVFDVDVTGAELISLVDHVIQDLFSADRLERLGNRCDRIAVTLLSYLDVIVMHFTGRVITKHEVAEAEVADQKEINGMAIIVIRLFK